MLPQEFYKFIVAPCQQFFAVSKRATGVELYRSRFCGPLRRCRVPACAPGYYSTRCAPPATIVGVVDLLSSAHPARRAAFFTLERKIRGAAANPASGYLATSAATHALSAGAGSGGLVSHSCGTLTGDGSPLPPAKSGSPLWRSAASPAPLVHHLWLSSVLFTSVAAVSLIVSPLPSHARPVGGIDTSTPPLPTSSEAASRLFPIGFYSGGAAKLTRKGTAHHKNLKTTRTEVAGQKTLLTTAFEIPQQGTPGSGGTPVSSVCERGSRSTTCSRKGSKYNKSSPQLGVRSLASSARRLSSFFFLPPSLRRPRWRTAGDRSRLDLPAATVYEAAFTGPARVARSPQTVRALQTANFNSYVQRRLSTMSTMSGFDPKDPKQAADVVIVPVLSDNYAFLLIDRETKEAACVDPAEPDKVLHAAEKEGVKLTLCLCTHKHHDHSGGNEEMAKKGLQVVGSAYEDTPGVTRKLKDKDTVNLGELRIEALHAPCHTSGHLLYFVTNAEEPTLAPILFSGDTLFTGGCGRFFEGSAHQMHHALIDVCSKLPDSTRVYSGHEYTQANLEFALTIEPDNEDLKAKYAWAKQQRSMGKPTIPSTIAQEKCYNPFMRTDTNSVQSKVGALGDPIETMRLLRQKKNNFKS